MKAPLLIATNNKNKVREIREILGGEFEEILSLGDIGASVDVVEDRDTFFGNALKKAEEISHATGYVTIADDSGLMVEALDGAPGVHSARYAMDFGILGDPTEQNNLLLLRNLSGKQNRRACFVSTVVLYYPDGKYLVGEGRCEGEIMLEPKGVAGFGYDPLFYSYDLGCGFGVATSSQKNEVSHRARAIRDLLGKLKDNA